MTLEAVENGTRASTGRPTCRGWCSLRSCVRPVDLAGGFEFVQWFFGFKRHQVLEKSKHPLLMVVVLRKK
jgi:hypothetical protein